MSPDVTATVTATVHDGKRRENAGKIGMSGWRRSCRLEVGNCMENQQDWLEARAGFEPANKGFADLSHAFITGSLSGAAPVFATVHRRPLNNGASICHECREALAEAVGEVQL